MHLIVDCGSKFVKLNKNQKIGRRQEFGGNIGGFIVDGIEPIAAR